jgi:hypothetical protein
MILELIGKIITPKSRKIKEEKKMLSVVIFVRCVECGA